MFHWNTGLDKSITNFYCHTCTKYKITRTMFHVIINKVRLRASTLMILSYNLLPFATLCNHYQCSCQ